MDEDVKIIVKKVLWGLVLLAIVTVVALAVMFPAYFPVTQTQAWKSCGAIEPFGVCEVKKEPASAPLSSTVTAPLDPVSSKPLPTATPQPSKTKAKW